MIQDSKEGFIPAPYTVICHALLTKENGNAPEYVGKYLTHRIGVAHDIEGCKKLIDEDLKAIGDTFGGLIEAVSTKGRSYQIFKAIWEEVK